MSLLEWESWRLVNAGAALVALLFYTWNTAALWPQWSPSERRVSATVCALLAVLAAGSLEAYAADQPVLVSTFALAAVLTCMAATLADDRWTRTRRPSRNRT